MLLLRWYIVLGKNRLHRTLGHTQGTINAFFWVNHQKIGTFVETVHWAEIYTVGVFTLDAAFSYNISHGCSSFPLRSATLTFAILPESIQAPLQLNRDNNIRFHRDLPPRSYQDYRNRHRSCLVYEQSVK